VQAFRPASEADLSGGSDLIRAKVTRMTLRRKRTSTCVQRIDAKTKRIVAGSDLICARVWRIGSGLSRILSGMQRITS